jgi:hypothetical protein
MLRQMYVTFVVFLFTAALVKKYTRVCGSAIRAPCASTSEGHAGVVVRKGHPNENVGLQYQRLP